MVHPLQASDGLKSDGLPQSEMNNKESLNTKGNAGMLPDSLLPCKWMSVKRCKSTKFVLFPVNSL
jgi:hypothetical protein